MLKSLTSVQLDPFHSSATATSPGGALPPATIADVDVPPPLCPFLTVFKSFNSVHVEPLKDSVTPTFPGGASPPIAKAAVVTPAPHNLFLPVFKLAEDAQEENIFGT